MEDKNKIPGEGLEVSMDMRTEAVPEGQGRAEDTHSEEEHFGVEDSVIGTEIVRHKMSFGEWVENFWYHHKWHLLASLFIIAVLAVCITQCAMNAKAPTDVKIIYAGNAFISKQTEEDGTVPFREMENAFSSLSRDYDENGERLAELECYYWLSVKEIEEIGKLAEEDRPVNLETVGPVVKESNNAITTMLLTNDYYVWLISDDLYDYLTNNGGEGRFDPLDVLAEDGAALPFYVDEDGVTHTRAVYLSELGVSELEGLCDLPEDTLVVLKHPSVLDRDLTEYENAVDYIRILLNS